MNTPVQSERRQFKRFRVDGPAYAAVGPELACMGHIINISRGGVAFSYVRHTGRPTNIGETLIRLSDNQTSLCDMPFVSISDQAADPVDPFSSVEIRLHRGCFGTLSREQLDDLIVFLEEKTPFEPVRN
ncbi:hypothetical protein JCM14469_34960 [Desulfatiferula olefinivorans]